MRNKKMKRYIVNEMKIRRRFIVIYLNVSISSKSNLVPLIDRKSVLQMTDKLLWGFWNYEHQSPIENKISRKEKKTIINWGRVQTCTEISILNSHSDNNTGGQYCTRKHTDADSFVNDNSHFITSHHIKSNR